MSGASNSTRRTRRRKPACRGGRHPSAAVVWSMRACARRVARRALLERAQSCVGAVPVRHRSTTNSAQWHRRQTRDTFVEEARGEGLRSRAALKLQQLNHSFRILSKGDVVVDLGCAPGGWCQVAARAVGSRGGFVCDARSLERESAEGGALARPASAAAKASAPTPAERSGLRTVSVFGVASDEAAAAAAAAGLPVSGSASRRWASTSAERGTSWVSAADASEDTEADGVGSAGSAGSLGALDDRYDDDDDDQWPAPTGRAGVSDSSGRAEGGSGSGSDPAHGDLALGQRHNRVGDCEWVAGGSVLVGSRRAAGRQDGSGGALGSGRRRRRQLDEDSDGAADDDDEGSEQEGGGGGGGAASVWLDSDDSDGDEVLPSQRKRELFSPVSGAAPGDAAASNVDSVALPRVLAAELSAQTAALHFGSAEGAGRVVGLDLLPVRPVWGAAILRGDFTTDGVRRGVRAILPGGTASVVLSDMAHHFIGDSATDTSIQTDLAWTAAEFACGVMAERGAGGRPGRAPVLRRGGHAVMKIRGVGDPGVAALLAALEPVFRRCVVEKPAASRAASAEAFLVCLSFRGRRIRRRQLRS